MLRRWSVSRESFQKIRFVIVSHLAARRSQTKLFTSVFLVDRVCHLLGSYQAGIYSQVQVSSPPLSQPITPNRNLTPPAFLPSSTHPTEHARRLNADCLKFKDRSDMLSEELLAYPADIICLQVSPLTPTYAPFVSASWVRLSIIILTRRYGWVRKRIG